MRSSLSRFPSSFRLFSSLPLPRPRPSFSSPFSPLLFSAVRHFGVFSGVSDMFRNRAESQQLQLAKENFSSFIASLAAAKEYSLEHYEEFQKATAKAAGLDSWKSKVLGQDKSEATENLKRSLSILAAIPPALQRAPERIGMEDKVAIARLAGFPVAEVNRVLKDFRQVSQLHKWIRYRAARGKELPTSQQQMQEQIRQEREAARFQERSGLRMKRTIKRHKANFNDPSY